MLILVLTACATCVFAQELLSVKLNIDGREFGIKFPENLSPRSVAEHFCVEQAGTLNIVQETLPNCIAPVENFLVSAISDEIRKKSVRDLQQRNVLIQLKVNEIDYEITFQPSAVSIEAVASTFCQEKAPELGVTTETLSNCVTQINAYIMQQLKDYVDANSKQQMMMPAPGTPPMRVPLRIGDRDFTVEFVHQLTTPQQVATQFCVEQGASLGFTTETVAGCIDPVQNYLANAISSQLSATAGAESKAKPFEVSLMIGSEEFKLAFDPYTVSARTAAGQFCGEKGYSFGITQENVMTACVAPVQKLIQESIDKQYNRAA